MMIFNLDTDGRVAQGLAAQLDVELAPHEARVFEDGERKWRPLVDPRGADVYVVHSLHGDAQASPHDKLIALMMFVATLVDHGARRVSAVVPYMAYARKDRRTKPFDPLSQRYVAQLLEAAGVAQLFVLEVHNPAALENAFRCPAVHLPCHPAFDAVAALQGTARLVVVSPDPGGVKRAQLWREHLEARLQRRVGFALIDKRRSGGLVSGDAIVCGDAEGATVLLLDDLIATGHTLVRAAHALRAAKARHVLAFAAHGLFVEAADHSLGDPAIDQVIVCDSVPPFRVRGGSPLAPKLEVVSCVPLFASAIRESHASWSR